MSASGADHSANNAKVVEVGHPLTAYIVTQPRTRQKTDQKCQFLDVFCRFRGESWTAHAPPNLPASAAHANDILESITVGQCCAILQHRTPCHRLPPANCKFAAFQTLCHQLPKEARHNHITAHVVLVLPKLLLSIPKDGDQAARETHPPQHKFGQAAEMANALPPQLQRRLVVKNPQFMMMMMVVVMMMMMMFPPCA